MIRRALALLAVGGLAASVACADILGITDVPPATDEAGAPDAATDAPAKKCDPYGSFSSIEPVASLTGPDFVSVMLSPDENTAFVCKFDTARSRTSLYLLKRSKVSDPFAQPTLLIDHACSASISADGTHFLYEFDDSKDGTGGNGDPNDFLVYQVSSPSGALAALDAATGAALGLSNTPFVVPDGTAFYFTNTQPPIEGIYRGVYPSFATTKLKSISATASAPLVTPDELVLYFSENGLAVATRSSTSDDFANVQELVVSEASTDTVRPAFVSADLCTVYFTRVTRTVTDAGTSYSGETSVGVRTP